MQRSKYFLLSGLLIIASALFVFVAGCQRSSTSSSDTKQPREQSDDAGHAEPEADHQHKLGGHGGTVVEVGQDNYHVEVVFAADGKLHLFTLGRDEAKIQEVDVQQLTAFAKPEGGDAIQFSLTADPQADDPQGKTSAFVGQLPEEVNGKKIEVTIPSIRIGEERFRIGFSSEDTGPPADHVEVPEPAPKDEQEALFLTPGGAYTKADIAANGNVTPAEKFKGLVSNHNLQPIKGDRICPVTLTKANPEFSWVVGGKTYQFCCPPCIDEFVANAKSNPGDLKEPESYVKE